MAKKVTGVAVQLGNRKWRFSEESGAPMATEQRATLVVGDERVFTESEVRAMLAVIDVGLQNALHNFDCDLTPLQQSGEEYVEAAIAEDAKCTCGLDQAEAVIESLRNTPLLTNGA